MSFRYFFLFILSGILCIPVFAQQRNHPGILLKGNETLIISFKLKKSGKLVTVCRDTNHKYLVYRFGTKDSIELQYPAILDMTSWKKFSYSGYFRHGGKENAGLYDYALDFENNGAHYSIEESWNSEEEDKFYLQIVITEGIKKIIVKGDTKSQEFSLYGLLDEDSLLHNKAFDK